MVNIKDQLKASVNLKPKVQSAGLFEPTTQKQSVAQEKKPLTSTFKMDIYSDRVTLAISPEQRRFLDGLARDFQEKRTIKLETINRNTLVRGLIEVLRDVSFSADEVVNSEQEMISLLRRKLVKR